MNLSSKSTYDNVSEDAENYSKSFVYNAINDLLSVNDEVVKLFCPLCVNSFEYKFTLFKHLQTFHLNFLVKAENQKLRFNECPFCSAKFYGNHLTAKHSLLCHSKLIKEFLVDSNWKCTFCRKNLDNGYENLINHVQEMHFLTFEEEFKKKFSCARSFIINVPHSGNSLDNIKSDYNCLSLKDILLNSSTLDLEQKLEKSINMRDFEEASKINCYDFKDLKEQLEKIKDSNESLTIQSSLKKKRSILKDPKNITPRKSVRRVLRFDLTDSCKENKENSVLMYNLKSIKEINIDEHSLLCNDDAEKTEKFHYYSCENWYEKPKYSSTPNPEEENCMTEIVFTENDTKKNFKNTAKSFFKSYFTQNDAPEFQFQCGKCRKLFKKNLELVYHIKNNHKKFDLKGLQPCYRCGICNAKFFKNHYLKKHHGLHKFK